MKATEQKTIRLLFLSIRNFKGCESLDLTLAGRSVSIYGDNAAGKTTIYDALTWLLFGKDSRGRGDFEIKPLDGGGRVRDHGAVTQVEATLQTQDANITLRKTFFERWSTKRGSAEASYDGNTSEYFVDGVPSKKYEFERRVNELVDEELFRTLTNVTWFCEGMDWRARRKTLLEVCGAPDDRQIMAGEPRFAALAAAMGTLSLDDLKKKVTAQRKGLNGARSTIPARLDEQKKTVEALAGIDFSTLEAERDARAARLDQLSGELVRLSHGALADSRRNEAGSLRNELQKLVNENNRHRFSQLTPVADERPAMNAALEKAKRQARRSCGLAENEKQLIASTQEAIDRYRERWNQADGACFRAENCPTCGQPLPAAALDAARVRFEAEKERRKAEAVEGANWEKANLAAAEERQKMYSDEAAAAEAEAARLEQELADYVPGVPPAITDLPGFREQAGALTDRIKALEGEAQAMENESAAIREEIGRKCEALRGELAALDGELVKKALLSFAREREEELRQEARKTAEALEELDELLFLCDEFTHFKVGYLEESINSKFRLARFKLFQEQVNGGLADCCEAAYDGVPYGSLNNGMRVNLGVDVIRTISEHYGLRVPLVVDNAESVVSLADAGTQVIRLVVSGADKKLRCEYGA